MLTKPVGAGGPALYLYAFITLSGACGLVYEVLWARMFALLFGTTVTALSVVLACFMAGLALGSYAGRRCSDRLDNPLAVYGRLEIFIGVWALSVPPVIRLLLAGAADGLLPTGFGANLLAGCLMIIPPAAAMGLTLPVLVAYAQRRYGGDVSRLAGTMYALNTFGAVAGTLAGGFLLIEVLGATGTICLTAALNLLVGGIAVVLAGSAGQLAGEPRLEAEPGAAGRTGCTGILMLYAVVGFTAMAFEVAWTRALVYALGNNVYAFTTMLASFLLGIAGGSLVFARLGGRVRNTGPAIAVILLLIGVWGLFSTDVINRLHLIPHLLKLSPSWGNYMLMRFSLGLAALAVPTLLYGFLFPLLLRHAVGDRREVGAGGITGAMLAANTAGGVLGSLVCGFVLLKYAGLENAIAAISVLAGATGLVLIGLMRPARRYVPCAVAGLAVMAVLFPLREPFRPGRSGPPGTELEFYHEDEVATVTVFTDHRGFKSLMINGIEEVPTDRASIKTFRLLGLLPMLFHDHPRDVFVICFGGGITLDAARSYGVSSLTCADIAPGVFRAGRFFQDYNHGVLDDTGIKFIVNDGRQQLLAERRSFDVIISDATHPRSADSWLLYTAEFYALARRRLRDDGIFAQWIPMHRLSTSDYLSIVRTMQQTFASVMLWHAVDHTVLLGFKSGEVSPAGAVAARLASYGRRRGLLAEVGVTDAGTLYRNLISDGRNLAAELAAVPVNTDDRTYVEFSESRVYIQETRGPMQNFLHDRRDLRTVTDAAAGLDHASLARHYAAAQLLMQSRYTEPPGRVALLREAGKLVPGDTEMDFYLQEALAAAR